MQEKRRRNVLFECQTIFEVPTGALAQDHLKVVILASSNWHQMSLGSSASIKDEREKLRNSKFSSYSRPGFTFQDREGIQFPQWRSAFAANA